MSYLFGGYTVISHVFNEEKHLSACIDAVFSQTLKPEAFFIVDDASTDGTDEIIHKYNINHIHLPNRDAPSYKRRGWAFNKAVEQVRTQYVLKVDGDIEICSEYGDTLLSLMLSNPRIGASSGISQTYLKTRDLNNGAVMYRTRVLPKAKPVYGWDREIQLDITRQGYGIYVTKKVYYNDLRPPRVIKPNLLRVFINRTRKKYAETQGMIKRLFW